MTIALQILQIHVEDHSVLYMKTNGGPDVVCVTVIIKRFLAHRHVSNIKESGINMPRITLSKAFRELEECYGDLERVCLGSQLLMSIYNHMMNLLLKHKEEIILVPLVFIVWKQYVLHVAQ
jgi:hypothetical protein